MPVDSPLSEKNEARLIALAKANYSSDLKPTELEVLRVSVQPGPAKAPSGACVNARTVRGNFLRWLLNDGEAAKLIYKDGVWVVRATIEGDVDLDGAKIACFLTIQECVFTGAFHSLWAVTRTIHILDCKADQSVNLSDTSVDGDLFLDGLQSSSSIEMYAVHIAGDLSLERVKLAGSAKQLSPDNPQVQLSLDNAEVQGVVYLENLSCAGPVAMFGARLQNKVIATGAQFGSTVKMTGANIAGDLVLVDIQASLQKQAAPDHATIAAVLLDEVKIGGSVYLEGANLQCKPASLSLRYASIAGDVHLMSDGNSPFQASGSVSLTGAVLKRDLLVLDAELAGLECTDAQILGGLLWASIRNPQNTKLALVRASINRLRDVKSSWPAPGNLQLNGLVYQEIWLKVPPDTSAVPSDGSWKDGTIPDDRIAWLQLQADPLASQPWLQLAQYVHAKGNPDGAGQVIYKMRRVQGWAAGPLSYAKSAFNGFIEEDNLHILYFIGLLWLLGWIIFWRARRMNDKAMAPREGAAYNNFLEHDVPPAGYIPFNPVVYALENVLPVVKLGQDDAWGPNPQLNPTLRQGWKRCLPQNSYRWLAITRWVLIVCGWGLAAILAGAIADHFKP